MRHIEFELAGKTYTLAFTAEALFTIYDRIGVTDDLLEDSHCMEPTAEGWKSLCWVAALMAAQGELQRRQAGEDPKPMLTMEQLRILCTPADSLRLRKAVRDAMEQGFRRDVPDPDMDQEINLVLAEREKNEKKAKALVLNGLRTWLQRLSGCTSDHKTP